MTATVTWNDAVRLVISDVDETIAALYEPAHPRLVDHLAALLDSGVALVLATGQGIDNVWERLLSLLPVGPRRRVLAGCCSGAELWGISHDGRHERRMASPYDALEAGASLRWRDAIDQVVAELGLVTHDTMDLASFRRVAGTRPEAVMLDDRGAQVTLEMPNGVTPGGSSAEGGAGAGGADLRSAVHARAQELFAKFDLPFTSVLASTFAVDFVVTGVSKGSIVRALAGSPGLLEDLGVDARVLLDPAAVEVWGDNFSVQRGGIDLRISEELPPAVRSISFRDVAAEDLPADRNVVRWDGRHRLHEGLLEYLDCWRGTR